MQIITHVKQTQQKSSGSRPRPLPYRPAIAHDRDLAGPFARLCLAVDRAGIDALQAVYAGHLAMPIGPGVDLAIIAGIKAETFAAEDQAVIWCSAVDSRHETIGDALLLAARRLMHSRYWDAGEPHFRRGPLWSVASLVDLSAQHPGPIGILLALAAKLIDLHQRMTKAAEHFDFANHLLQGGK
jgi:hypothetical protein